MYILLLLLGLFGSILGLVLIVIGFFKKKKNKGSLIAIVSAILVIIAFIMIPPAEKAEENIPVDEATEENATNHSIEAPTIETIEGETITDDWNAFIDELVANGESEQEKFKALELYASDYVTNDTEFKDFSQTIVVDYMMGTYLNNHTDHKTMLTKIFKSFVVEKNATGAVKDFAFDYYQNVKYVYRGVDAIDSVAVKSNERQMDDAIDRISQPSTN